MKSKFDISVLNTPKGATPTTDTGYVPYQYEQDLKDLLMLKEYVKNLDMAYSQEGLGTGLLKVFINVTDIFIRVGNTFKTNLLKFAKDIKRSEMRAYYESHTLLCNKTEGTPITTVTNIEVPLPTGMKGTYANACNIVNQVYSALDLVTCANGVLAALKDLRHKLMNSKEYKSSLVPLTNVMKQRAGYLAISQKNINNTFTTQKTPLYTKFIDVYKSMKEFKDTRVALMNMESHLTDASKLTSILDEIDGVLAQITSYLSEDTEVDKVMVNTLIDVVRFMASCFDLYGATNLRQMALEHNHIVSIGRVWAAIE